MHTLYVPTPKGVSIVLPPFRGGRKKLVEAFNRRFHDSPLDPRIESLLLDKEFRDIHVHLPLELRAVTLSDNGIRNRVKAQSLVDKNLASSTPNELMTTCPSSTPLRFALELDNIWCYLPEKARRHYTLFPIKKINGKMASLAIRVQLLHLGTPIKVSMVEISEYILEPHELCVFKNVKVKQ